MNIIELAKQANGEPATPGGVDWSWGELEAFAKLVVANIDPKSFMSWQEGYEAGAAHEREACAKVCEKQIKIFLSPRYSTGQPLSSFKERHAIASCVEAIRERGTT